jgi:heme/copper-type cytochrome/quinol oxidase subunit 3
MKRLALILGIVLFLLGIVAVVHPTFEYHTRERVAKFGPVEATMDEPKTFEVPTAATVALLVSGLVLAVASFKMKS